MDVVRNAVDQVSGHVNAATQQSRGPPREQWHYTLCEACQDDTNFCLYGFFCPCCANSSLKAFMDKKKPAPCGRWNCLVATFCFCDEFCSTRNEIREKAYMTQPVCGEDNGCDTCCSLVFCHGCALAQEHRELQILYGHREAPNKGPAAQTMQ
eukprot:TRINITY_DN65816_c8_g1_i1.p2 TRINITY_DN65816_c8_g1~~TRINITY_DN65816_c8_g1_i1.p2  ORF type:complete len:162 (-),score=57.49 TRINITY_DN65816_c8_g1_i1:182-640(-)